ncbi:hypothetical protein K525DRAFT_259711 [Schizophyllum commune Loenen D]|nr:hypothetical protein K525DRAFT_259711 [Schizophyllum commune Loenen D]
MSAGTPATWSYILIRLLFKFVLKIFYGTIVIENADLIPEDGHPCIRRKMLRLTAKATQFGRGTFTSWLIESAGTVPLKRAKDYPDGKVDNSEVMLKLMEALEAGDAVCLFPEGMSRYHPSIAPMKTGVARLVSDVLSRNRDDPDFKISILPCSVTYMHRQHFRSDVLVSFHEPMTFRPNASSLENPELLAPVDFNNIRELTAKLHNTISSGTLDAPSWDMARTAKLAARIYAPLGTQMSLGEYVRVTQRFLDAFKSKEVMADELDDLQQELKHYQDQLVQWGIKDDRVRRPLPRHTILYRMSIRLPWALFLFLLCLPGLTLWLPVFLATFVAVHNFKKTGPIFDTWDEIAQYKLVYGLFSGLGVWALAVLLTLPCAALTFVVVPVVMWMGLRWFEDAVASFRAFTALLRLLKVGKPTLEAMRERRAGLHERIMRLAKEIDLPEDPEEHFRSAGGREKGRIMGKWDAKARYFSLKRRRKRDWNETLRLYDKVDYPAED